MSTSGKGWTLLRSVAEWDDYRRNYELTQSWPQDQVVWPSKPASYPCLVSTYSPNLYKVVTAFVYVTQATQLLAAAGMNVSRNPAFPEEDGRMASTGDIGEMQKNPVGGVPKRPGTRSQANVNRYVQANLLAIWRALKPKHDSHDKEFLLAGGTNPKSSNVEGVTAEQAQDMVLEALSDVDRWAAADLTERAKMNDNSFLEKLDTGE